VRRHETQSEGLTSQLCNLGTKAPSKLMFSRHVE
jgi:hypothetical protein